MRSSSCPRAVSISTGTSEAARIRRQTSKPSRSGSITSSSTALQPSDEPPQALGRRTRRGDLVAEGLQVVAHQSRRAPRRRRSAVGAPPDGS